MNLTRNLLPLLLGLLAVVLLIVDATTADEWHPATDCDAESTPFDEVTK